MRDMDKCFFAMVELSQLDISVLTLKEVILYNNLLNHSGIFVSLQPWKKQLKSS